MTWFWPEVPSYSYARRLTTSQAVSAIHFSDILIVIKLLLWN